MVVAVTGARGVLGRQLLPLLGERALILEGDVRLAGTFAHRFQWLVHLAGALPHHFRQDAATALAVNVEGTRRALEACRSNGAGLVLASSSAVYPVDRQGALAETVPAAPVMPYGVSKVMAEELAEFYHQNFAVPVKILRFFNVYGPGQGEELLPGYLIRKALRGEAITLHSPCSGRDFIHARDGARALLAALVPGESPHRVFNVGSGVAHAVRDWVTLLEEVVGRKLEVDMAEHPATDCVVADLTRTRQWLSWQPTLTLAQGIAATVAALSQPGNAP